MEGIILAAGLSTRFPEYKLKQEIKGKPLLLHTLETMLSFVTHAYIVTGHNHELIESMVKTYDNVTCLFNESYDDDMFLSVKQGVSAINSDFFLIPADCPFIKPHTYELLRIEDGDVVLPSYEFKCGHPIKLSLSIKEALLSSEDIHLRAFLNGYDKKYVTVDDPFVLMDIDTREDLEAIRGRIT